MIEDGVWESEMARFECKEGVLYGDYYPVNGNTHVSLAYAKRLVEFRQKITNGDKVCMVIDINRFTGIDRDARAYWATESATKDVLCGAIIAKSPIVVMVVNFFHLINKPPLPSKMFSSAKKAESWVREQMVETV